MTLPSPLQPKLKQFRGKTFLITGASSGIGEAIARELAPVAGKIILTARRVDRLEKLKQELLGLNASLDVHVQSLDLADRTALKAFCDRAEEKNEIDFLVNNAGLGLFGSFTTHSPEAIDQMIEVNVRAIAYLSRRLIPSMRLKKDSGILNISSGFGLTFSPGFAAYVGTKHFVSGLSESLICELAGTSVRVSQVCPGPVKTEFAIHASGATELRAPAIFEISAERCAREALRGFHSKTPVIVPSLRMKALILLSQVTPRWIMRFVYRPIGKALRQSEEKRSR